MPTYIITDTKKKKTFDVFCSWNELQKLLKEKQMAENQLAMAQEADANTVVAKNEGELEQRIHDLEQRLV